MGDRAALISLFIKEGVSDPKVMRRLYDEAGDTADIKPAVSNASYPRERDVLDLVNNSKADFVSRLIDENRVTIPDWNNKDDIATHKLSYARDGDRWIIYPNVQNIDGKLYDFSDPKYGLDKGRQALDSALYSGDYVEVPSEADARWFTESYKRYYPGFNKYDGKTEKSQKMVRLGNDDYLVPGELKPSVVTPDSNKEKIIIPIDYLFPERDDVGYKLDTLRDVMQSMVDRDKKVRNNPLETLKVYNSAYRNPFIENPYYRNYINYGYNRFDKGGKSDSYNTGEIKEYNWNAFDTWAARHPQTMMRLRKAKTLAEDLLALHPVLGIYDDIMDYINQKPQEERDAREEINSITTASGLGGKVVNSLYGKPVKKIFNDSEWSNAFKKFSNILNIPDKINDSIKFIDDFSRPVNEFDKGGDTIDKPRVDYIMKDLPLRAAVYDLSKQYGVSPAAIFYRLGREGAVDSRIRDRYYIGEGNQMSMIDSGSLDEYDMNDAFGYYGLDDTFERYKKGQIHTRRKIPFALGVAVNEKGRLTSSIDDTFSKLNQYDMLELMAAELEGFKNMAKKAYPGKDEDWYDRAAVTGYNRGPGFIKWLKTNDPYDISAYSGITDSGYKSNNAKPNTIDVPYSSHVNSYYDDMLKIYNTVGPMLPTGREMRRYNFLKSIGIKDSDMFDYESLNKAFVTEPDITEPISYTRPYLNTGYKFMSGGKIRNK